MGVMVQPSSKNILEIGGLLCRFLAMTAIDRTADFREVVVVGGWSIPTACDMLRLGPP